MGLPPSRTSPRTCFGVLKSCRTADVTKTDVETLPEFASEHLMPRGADVRDLFPAPFLRRPIIMFLSTGRGSRALPTAAALQYSSRDIRAIVRTKWMGNSPRRHRCSRVQTLYRVPSLGLLGLNWNRFTMSYSLASSRVRPAPHSKALSGPSTCFSYNFAGCLTDRCQFCSISAC